MGGGVPEVEVQRRQREAAAEAIQQMKLHQEVERLQAEEAQRRARAREQEAEKRRQAEEQAA